MRRSVFALLLGLMSPLHAVSWTPLTRITALGGQYFTESTHSTGANVDYSFVPVIGFNSRLHLIPILVGSYNQTQSVYNFLGENTLIQGQLEQMGVLRLSYAPTTRWRWKPRVGYKRSWIKQNSDASLSEGLFNTGRAFTGLSLERLGERHSIEASYEYSQTRYPNYQALDADPRLTTTGITASAGTNVLDMNTHETSLNTTWASPGKQWTVSGNLAWLRENFVDQKVITQDASGFETFVNESRTDNILNLSLQQGWTPESAWLFQSGETLQSYLSNQNAYDATQLFANPYTFHYYNFWDAQWTPSITRRWRKGTVDLTLAGQLGYRRYENRRAQESDGTYRDARIWSANRGGTLTLRYKIPRVKGLFAVLTSSVLTFWSNTRYEANYPYNYTVLNYLGGLSWEY